MLDWITHSGVAVEGRSRELLRKFTLLDILGMRGVMEAGGRNQVMGELGLNDQLVDQLIKDVEIWGPASVALCPREVVLKGGDLSLELLIEQLQLFLSAKDVVAVENHLLLLAL